MLWISVKESDYISVLHKFKGFVVQSQFDGT